MRIFGKKADQKRTSIAVLICDNICQPICNLLTFLGKSPHDYIKAICHREIAWIDLYAVPKPSHNLFSRVRRSKYSKQSHHTLQKASRYCGLNTPKKPGNGQIHGIGISTHLTSSLLTVKLQASSIGKTYGPALYFFKHSIRGLSGTAGN